MRQLKDWVPLTEAAEELGISRQGLHHRVNTGSIPAKWLRRISQGSRSTVLISTEYIAQQQPWNHEEEE